MPLLHPGLPPSALHPPSDPGRWIARVLCVLFALVGLIPPALGALTRWQPIQDWAARETGRILSEQVGLNAKYRVGVSLWPLSLELSEVTLDSNDGGPPVLTTPRLTIRPRLFSLLAGRVDAGQIAVEQPEIRVVIKDGVLQNLTLPTSSGSSQQLPI
ncbi:MAG TPA: hypothetical protein VJU61_00235, partial [Polyangiaceae bacterium]|nr:hypothetical protein [Polyangiaceae bacterium]